MPYSPLASVAATRAVLDGFGLSAKYALGQNYLVSDEVVGGILELASLRPTDVVLEVGPGIGTLTSALLPRASEVVAVEADRDMERPLAETCAAYSERLALVLGDALRVTPQQVGRALADLRGRGAGRPAAVPAGAARGGGAPTPAARAQDAGSAPAGPAMPAAPRELPNRWVSNLPYAVAATLVLKWFESPDWAFLDDAVVMVQSEVADRICAQPGSKIYGAYTLKLQLHARVTGRFQVGARSFFPAPHVDSAVVRIERRPAGERLPPEEARACAAVIDAAFSQRRKTIRNAMSGASFATKERLDAGFAQAGISPAARAETLVLDDFVRLERALR